jgi:propanol-preferring alcohol dehydrogenase
VGSLVPKALRDVDKGAVVVCGGIHMSDIPSFSYNLLWEERSVCSVANLTRKDGEEFFEIAPKVPVRTEITTYKLPDVFAHYYDVLPESLTGKLIRHYQI